MAELIDHFNQVPTIIYVKEGKEYYLRIIIDKPEGIDISDCETVNNAINDIAVLAEFNFFDYWR